MTPDPLLPLSKSKHPESFDCAHEGCDAEVFKPRRYCDKCLRDLLGDRPMKLGLVVVAPDDTIQGAIVRRDGEPWHYEERQ